MRRFVSAAVAVLLAGAFVLVGAPAHAIEVPPPPPVSESPYTSSTLRQTSTPFTGTPLTEAQKAERELRYRLLQGTNTAGAVDTPDKVPQVAGKPSLLTRAGIGAGILGAGVLVVPMLTREGIKMMGISAEVGGQSYDEIVCGSIGSTNDGGFMEWLYGDLDCTPPVVGANGDVVASTGIAGYVTNLHFVEQAGNRYLCASTVATLTGGSSYEFLQNGGSWAQAIPSQSGFNPVCGVPKWIFSGSVSAIGAATGPSGPMRVINSSGGVVAVSTTTEADPEREVTCEVEWSDGSFTTGTAAAYRESEGFPLSEVDCQGAYDQRPSEDVVPVGITIDSEHGGTSTKLAEFDVPADLEAPKPSRGLRLEKVVSGVTQSCMTWEADCVGWWAATDEGTATTSPYRCMFGDASVPLDECGLYRYTFDEKTDTPTITDPVTGDEIQWHSSPDGRNSTNPGTGPTPGEDCLNNWPSIADPISWVLHPVKCALVWAFVPRTSEVDRLTGELTSMWEDTGVGLTVNTITAWEFAAPSSGCGGVLVPMSTIFQHGVEDFRLLDACAGSPLQQTAVWSYWIILIASIINLIASITRNVGSVVGARGVAEGDEK